MEIENNSAEPTEAHLKQIRKLEERAKGKFFVLFGRYEDNWVGVLRPRVCVSSGVQHPKYKCDDIFVPIGYQRVEGTSFEEVSNLLDIALKLYNL